MFQHQCISDYSTSRVTEEFSEDPAKQALWSAFVRKGRLAVESKTHSEVVTELRAFLMPPAIAASSEPFRKRRPKGNGNDRNQMPPLDL